ncbi:sensor histidine kinase [Saccharomonospora glauca]|uniref:histidine kinase n=1 Tax=Saccharomonospora glauca K62 TaxID=928724 RepID=I1CYW2_9PSEU|nr:ATP-binding protein [Saccharomonospora glauca]EIE97886.1 histidine kinase [Saccharomonospora glauca K62]
MSATTLSDTAVRHSDPRHRGHGADNMDVVDELRSRLLRVCLVSVAVVVLLGVAGLSAVLVDQSFGVAATVGVAVGCVLVLLVAARVVHGVVGSVGVLRPYGQPPVELPSEQPTAAPGAAPLSPHAATGQTSDHPTVTTQPAVGTQPGTAAPSTVNGGPAETAQASQPHRNESTETFPTVFGDSSSEHRREVFGKLARRLQSLSNREIQKIDELEREIEDPDLLKGLYEVDHLATRVRRQAENLAVLGGESPQRRSANPVSVYAVLRSAVAEVEHYQQVSIVPIEGVTLRGHVVAEVIHLLAELLENATNFSSPDAGKVVLRAQKVTAGLALEIQDRGLGMPAEDLQRINGLLDGTEQVNIDELLQDGRIGLAVVRELSLRHGIRVRLQTNIFGGIDAVVVLPPRLLGEPIPPQTPRREAAPARREAPSQPCPGTEKAAPSSQASNSVAAASHSLPLPEPHNNGAELYVPSLERDSAPQRQASKSDEHVPSLPVRKPGATFHSEPSSPSPEPKTGTDEARPAESHPLTDQSRPPLPQRRGESHLPPELHKALSPTKPIPGHNPTLMASFQQGFRRGREEQDRREEQEGPGWPQQ